MRNLVKNRSVYSSASVKTFQNGNPLFLPKKKIEGTRSLFRQGPEKRDGEGEKKENYFVLYGAWLPNSTRVKVSIDIPKSPEYFF